MNLENAQNIVPIVAISDNKLAFALATLFVNCMETKDSTTFYEFIAILDPDLEQDNIEKIKFIESLYPNCCSVNIISMDSRFKNIANNTGYIANACASKMILGELLPQYDKVLYLDTDLVIFRDLFDLYSTQLANNYIGGVFSLEHYLGRRDLAQLLDIPNLASYVNAGMLVFNLAQIRKDGAESKMHKMIGTYQDSVDQHIINKTCYGKVALLNPAWNVCRSSRSLYASEHYLISSTFGERLHRHPYIYHYTGTQKPWEYYNLPYALVWYRNFLKSPYKDHGLDLKFTAPLGDNKILVKKAVKRYFWNSLLFFITGQKRFEDRSNFYRYVRPCPVTDK